MDEKQLMKDFCLVSGLDEQQAEGWKPLVLGCWEELCRRLRPAVQPQEHRERLSLACAALAHYRLQRMQGRGVQRHQGGGHLADSGQRTAVGGDGAGDGGRAAGQRRRLCAGGDVMRRNSDRFCHRALRMQSGIFAGRRKCGFKSIPKSPAGEGGKDRRRRFGNGAAGTMAAAGTL